MARRFLIYEPLYNAADQPPFPCMTYLMERTEGVEHSLLFGEKERHRQKLTAIYSRLHRPGAMGKIVKLQFLSSLFFRSVFAARRFRSYEHVVVLGNLPLLGAMIGKKLGLGGNAPISYYTYSSRRSSRGILNKAQDWAIRQCHTVLYISHKQVELHSPSSQARFVNVGMDSEFFDPAQVNLDSVANETRIAAEGAYLVVGDAGRKEEIVQQLAETSGQRFVRIGRRFYIVEHYRKLSESRPDLCDKLIFLENIPYNDLRAAYWLAKGVILPLIFEDEPWGLTATIESLMMGKPVLTDHEFTYRALNLEEQAYVKFVSDGNWGKAMAEFAQLCDSADPAEISRVVRTSRSLKREAESILEALK